MIGRILLRFSNVVRFTAEHFELIQTLAHPATLAERARSSRNLHDALAHGLTAILMQLQASQRESDPQRARNHVRDALDSARPSLVEVRSSVHALRSAAPGRLDFMMALRGVLKTPFAGSTMVVGGQHSRDEYPSLIWSDRHRAVQSRRCHLVDLQRARPGKAHWRCLGSQR